VTHTFVEGDLVRIKASGFEGELQDINPRPLEEIDPTDEFWAEVSNDMRSKEIDGPDEIELVMSASDANARAVPTPEEIVRGLDLLGDGWDGAVNVDETEKDGEGSTVCFGRAANGLRVAFRVTVSDVERADF
jgi:hypothetical protein